jgi:putative oxidoreductase
VGQVFLFGDRPQEVWDMSVGAGIIELIGRVVFSIFFVNAGRQHIVNSSRFEGYARSVKFPIRGVAGWPSGILLLAGGLSVALGIWPDIGALCIAAFVVPAAWWFHRFWTVGDPDMRRSQQQLFFRNVVTLGACLVMFALFVTLGHALRFTITDPAFSF